MSARKCRHRDRYACGTCKKCQRVRQRRHRRTPGTYRYRAANMIGEAGQRHRLCAIVLSARRKAERDPRFEPMLAEVEQFLKENGYGKAEKE